MSNDVSSRMEDYLEAILQAQEESSVARVTEIAAELGVSKPTVTSALKKLGDTGLVDHESYGYIQLTEEGEEAARRVRSRHRLLRHFFRDILGVEEETATNDACQTEHYISETTLDRLTHFIHFISDCPRTGSEWLDHFQCYCKTCATEMAPSPPCSSECKARCLTEIQESNSGTCQEPDS